MSGILDRVLSLLPLGVLMYVLRRNETERARLLGAMERDQAFHRDQQRELVNRIVAPHLVPTGTRPADRPVAPAPSPLDAQRAAWARVGTASPMNLTLPGDADDVPGAE